MQLLALSSGLHEVSLQLCPCANKAAGSDYKWP